MPAFPSLSLLRLTAVGLACAGCVHRVHTATVATSTGEISMPIANSWLAVLAPLSALRSGLHGRATISVATGGQPATVLLFMTGLDPHQSYNWHIRRGSCSATEAKGPASEYAPVTVDARGRGTATGAFSLTDAALGDYHIGVIPADGTPIACGRLVPNTD